MKIGKTLKLRILIAGGAGFLLFLFLFFGPPDLYTVTSSPGFCDSCHVMDDQFEAWFRTGVHRPLKCVDCHLPHDNTAGHLFWKGIEGMRDFVSFHGNIFTEPIRLSYHGEKTVQGNCVRCHEGTVTFINTEGRNCWDCHRRVRHNYPDMRGKFTADSRR